MTILRVPALTIDPLQRAAAEAPEGPLVILGGPGTGKTHTIIARVAMLLKGGASPHTITCLTFSSRGAEDLRRQMENQPLTAEGAPHIFIGTIHHYASFYLRRSGHASIGISPHFTIWDQEQATEILTEIISRRQEGREGASAHDIRKIMDWYETNQTRTPEEEEPAEEGVWLEIIREYNQEKRDNPPGGPRTIAKSGKEVYKDREVRYGRYGGGGFSVRVFGAGAGPQEGQGSAKF